MSSFDLSEVAGNQAQNRNAERRLVVSLITQGRVYVTEENYILKSVKGMWRLEGDSQIDGQPLPEGTVDWVTVPEVGREQSSMSVSEFNNLFTGQGPAAGNDQYHIQFLYSHIQEMPLSHLGIKIIM